MVNPQISFKKSRWKIHGRFGFGTDPETDWKIILISTIVLTVLIIALNLLIFIRIDKREIFTVEKSVEGREKTLDISLLRETVLYYQSKALEFKRIKDVSPAGIEPASTP